MEKVYQKYLIIGGGGFLGRYIVEYLINRGEKFIKVFDIRKTFEDSKIEFIVGDITKIDDVINACKDINIVIHTASATHHGHNSNFMYNVNVEGTKNVINACLLQGVSKLIYTSSASVVFDGNNLFDVNEETPYAKYSLDPYSKTKELAEKLVIEANGKKGLMTCSLRPSGIFGPRDVQAWPGFLDAAKKGKSKYIIGNGKNYFDWTYVENLAFAHVLVSDKMTKDSKICGQCYFITNGEPIPFWDMARYIYKNFGYPEPSIKIPYWFVWILAIILEFISWLISPFIKYSPTFTRLRVANAGANRTFSIKKAKKDFGYQPTISLKEGMEKTLIWFKEQEKLKEQKKEK